MTSFSKIMAMLLLGSLVIVPYYTSAKGYGLGTERNAKFIAQMETACAPTERDASGKCKRSLRSVYGRDARGGGHGFGK